MVLFGIFEFSGAVGGVIGTAIRGEMGTVNGKGAAATNGAPNGRGAPHPPHPHPTPPPPPPPPPPPSGTKSRLALREVNREASAVSRVDFFYAAILFPVLSGQNFHSIPPSWASLRPAAPKKTGGTRNWGGGEAGRSA